MPASENGYKLYSRERKDNMIPPDPFTEEYRVTDYNLYKGHEKVIHLAISRPLFGIGPPSIVDIKATTNTRLLKEFKRDFSVSPAAFMMEHFIRQGHAKAITGELLKPSERLVRKLVAQGLVTTRRRLFGGLVLKATPAWRTLAKSRTKTLPHPTRAK